MTDKPTPQPTDWVRVLDESTGHEYSVQRRTADMHKDLKIIDGDAVDRNGRPLDAVTNAKKATKAATPKKEG